MDTSFLHHWYQKKVQDHNWKNLWFISGVLFDRDYEKVRGYIYKKWFLQYRYFLFDDISSESREVCTIEVKNHHKEFYEIIGKQVLNEQWIFLGHINDIEFDVLKKLKYLYIDTGYNLTLEKNNLIRRNIKKMSKKAVLSYEDDFILVQDTQIIKENKKTLENISKIFINIPTPNYTINFKKLWIEEQIKIRKS